MNDMVDMSRFVEAKSDQLNADDLIGAPRTITITRVTGNDGDQPVSIFYEGDGGKPFKPCKTIRRVLMGVWGRYANEYVGKSMTIYRDDKVTFGGLETGGIRISHMSGIDKETVVVVMKSKGKKAGVKILPLKMGQQGSGQAQAFADKMLTAISRAPDLDKLNSYIAGQQSKIDNLPDDLRGKVTDALEARRAVLDDDPFDGPSDDQRGEAFTGDKAALRKAIDAASDARSLEDAQADVVAADLSDEDRVELEHALQMRRDALSVGVN